MDVKYIENQRTKLVKAEAQQLFDKIVQHVVKCTPSKTYNFAVVWTPRERVIDDMIIDRTKDLFQEMGTKLSIKRSGNDVCGVLVNPEAASPLPTHKVKTFYWSRSPGKFVNKYTGDVVCLSIEGKDIGPAFTGTVREWYETFTETLIDAGNMIQRETKEHPETVYVSKDLATILECSVLYRPHFGVDPAPHMGVLCNRYKIFIDEDLPANVAIVSLTKNGTRYLVDVNVLDMNII